MAAIKVKNGKIGENLHFQRIRRVTGYLTGDYKTRFNDGKQAEVRDRVKHNLGEQSESEE